MALAFFVELYDLNNDSLINVTEFGEYLEHLVHDDTGHCDSAEQVFTAAGALADSNLAADSAELQLALALSVECVASVTCLPEVEVTITVEGEEYECHMEEDHDHEEEAPVRRLQHDHGEEEHGEVEASLGEFELHCELHDHGEEETSTGAYSASTWFKVLGLSFATSLCSVIGIFFIFCGINLESESSRKWIHSMMALALGVLLYVVFGHLTYESIELLDKGDQFGIYAMLGVFIGICVELIWPALTSRAEAEAAMDEEAEKGMELSVAELGTSNSDLRSQKGATIINILLGDFLHNFVDGVVIGLAFTVCEDDASLGIAVTIGIFFHEFPQEISDFMILIRCGLSFAQALLFNFLSGTSALIGALVILIFHDISENGQGVILAISTGILAFITLGEIFPFIIEEVQHKHDVGRIMLFLLIGLGIGIGLFFAPHEHCHGEGDHGHHDH